MRLTIYKGTREALIYEDSTYEFSLVVNGEDVEIRIPEITEEANPTSH